MKKPLKIAAIAGGVLIALVAVGAVFGLVRFNFSVAVLTCRTNQEIAPGIRTEIEDAASRYADDFFAQRADGLFDGFTPQLRAITNYEALQKIIRATGFKPDSVKDAQIVRVDLIEGVTSGPNTVTCQSSDSLKETRSFAVQPSKRQAYVAIDGHTVNNDMELTFWLDGDQGWKIYGFHLNPATIVGRSVTDFLTQARYERLKGHSFNAVLLFATARQLMYRGPDVQLAGTADIGKEFASLSIPKDLPGKEPVVWQVGDNKYTIVNMSVLGLGGKIYLSVTQYMDSPMSEPDFDRHNKRLIAEIQKRYPEYSQIFAGMIVGAVEKNRTNIFRTLYEIEPSEK